MPRTPEEQARFHRLTNTLGNLMAVLFTAVVCAVMFTIGLELVQWISTWVGD